MRAGFIPVYARRRQEVSPEPERHRVEPGTGARRRGQAAADDPGDDQDTRRGTHLAAACGLEESGLALRNSRRARPRPATGNQRASTKQRAGKDRESQRPNTHHQIAQPMATSAWKKKNYRENRTRN